MKISLLNRWKVPRLKESISKMCEREELEQTQRWPRPIIPVMGEELGAQSKTCITIQNPQMWPSGKQASQSMRI
jgi:hypothetical protein